MDQYRCYADLASVEREGVDYDKIVRPVPASGVAVIAPHGGGIEPKSDAIAEAIAGADFSYYCFRGCKSEKNGRLHITSHHFDEPQCVSLVAAHKWVVAIHGCDEPGDNVFLGGLDAELISDLTAALSRAGIKVATTGHHYPGTRPDNICNRGLSGKGVQIELTASFRRGEQVAAFVAAVRSMLSARQTGITLQSS